MKGLFGWTVLFVLFAGVLMGCSSSGQETPNKPSDAVGVIKEIRETGGIAQPDGGTNNVGPRFVSSSLPTSGKDKRFKWVPS